MRTHTISAAGTPFQAFGRRWRDEPEATAQQGWPYRLEVHTALGGKYATMSRNVQEKLNRGRGYARGWRLVTPGQYLGRSLASVHALGCTRQRRR